MGGQWLPTITPCTARASLMDVRTQIRRAAGCFANCDAIVHGERRLSYAEAWSRGVRLANALSERGLRPGDRLATLEMNSIEAADVLLAAAIGGFVRVPLYARNKRAAHEHMIGRTNCRLAIVDADYAHEIDGLEDEIPELECIIVRDQKYEAWLAAASDKDPDPEIASDHLYAIRHTGGTTGLPKGVAHTHRNWMAISASFIQVGPRIDAGDAVLHVGPLSHASGFLFTPFWEAGGRNVMMNGFEPGAFLDLLEREDIAYGFVAPTMLNAIVQYPDAYGRHFPKLKCLLSASAPLSERTALKAREVFGDVLYSGYGQTEILVVAGMGPKQWFGQVEGSTPLRSVGRALPDVDIEIRDDTGAALPPNEPGEIVARVADRQMLGFWNDPEETSKRVVDGWIRTGDIGTIDDNGFLYLLDRANDMIISGGFNIYPAEIENIIAQHPLVKAVAVFGVPHEKWGETPLAQVVVEDVASVDEAEIIKLVVEQLGSMKKPSKVVLTTEPLPLSNNGKVLRSQLRLPYWAGRDSRVSGA